MEAERMEAEHVKATEVYYYESGNEAKGLKCRNVA